MIKAIIFDAGGVIIDSYKQNIEWQIIKDAIFRISRINAKKIKEIIYYGHRLEEGKIKTADLITKVSLMFGVEKEKIRRYLLDEYFAKSAINKEISKLIKQLRKKYTIALLSNSIAEHTKFNKAKGRYKLFNPIILSCDVGLRKPLKEIYLLTLRKLRLKASECIFVDDDRRCIKTARKIGMNAILFRNVWQLKRNFVKLGINL